jgi:hypothetical protein
MKYFLTTLLLIAFVSISWKISEKETNPSPKFAVAKNTSMTVMDIADSIYQEIEPGKFQIPSSAAFVQAFQGYYALKMQGKIQKEILTIIDFSLSSTKKRLWVIDMKNSQILFQSLVAHGKNSGEEFAQKFSNIAESYQSSLGFYLTGETYYGKHGFSLRLDGLNKGINHAARDRAIVIHAADYVSEKFIQQHGRLGRSQGCPALPAEVNQSIINTIHGKSVLYIFHPSIASKSLSLLQS